MTKYYELDLAVIYLEDGPRAVWAANHDVLLLQDGRMVVVPVASLALTGEAMAAIDDNLFAECFIPHRTPDAGFIFNCHILNKLNHEPAILEMLALKKAAGDIHARYHQICQYKGDIEIGEGD